MVEVMDNGVGEIVQTLKVTGQYENTIFVFLSDNGASSNGNNGSLRGFIGSAYEGVSRVPAISELYNLSDDLGEKRFKF
jgi:arylsulfatase A-like enzyme